VVCAEVDLGIYSLLCQCVAEDYQNADTRLTAVVPIERHRCWLILWNDCECSAIDLPWSCSPWSDTHCREVHWLWLIAVLMIQLVRLNWSELLLYWRELLLYRREVLWCWSEPSKVEVLFVVKWHWSYVWVNGTKWYKVWHWRFWSSFVLILKWTVCTEVYLNLIWSWQLVSWDIRWATSCIWGLSCPNRWIEVLVCGVKILWLTHKSWQIWRSQVLNLVLKVP